MLIASCSAGRTGAGLRQFPDHPLPTPLAGADVVAGGVDATTGVAIWTTAAFPVVVEETTILSENRSK